MVSIRGRFKRAVRRVTTKVKKAFTPKPKTRKIIRATFAPSKPKPRQRITIKSPVASPITRGGRRPTISGRVIARAPVRRIRTSGGGRQPIRVARQAIASRPISTGITRPTIPATRARRIVARARVIRRPTPQRILRPRERPAFSGIPDPLARRVARTGRRAGSQFGDFIGGGFR